MLTPRAVCEFPCPAIDRALSAGRRLARLAGPSCDAEARALARRCERPMRRRWSG
jgi:hypothetical protein